MDRIADYITFVNDGKLVFNEAKDDVLERYAIVKGDMQLIDSDIRKEFIGIRETTLGFEGLVDNRRKAALFSNNAILENHP